MQNLKSKTFFTLYLKIKKQMATCSHIFLAVESECNHRSLFYAKSLHLLEAIFLYL
jgi:hypothetical protein